MASLNSRLITKDDLDLIPDLYQTERNLNPICHIKLFTPDSQWTWYIIEISKENYDMCYGYVNGLDSELGYFSLKEIETIRGTLGLEVERDSSFRQIPLSLIRCNKNNKVLL